MKGSLAAILKALTLPFGATAGKRIVMDGVAGKIVVYGDDPGDFMSIDSDSGFPEIAMHQKSASSSAYITVGLGNFGTSAPQMQSSSYTSTVSGNKVRARIIAAANLLRCGITSLPDANGTVAEDGGMFSADDAAAYVRVSRNGTVKSQIKLTETSIDLTSAEVRAGGIYATRNGVVQGWIDLPLMNGWTNRGGIGSKLAVRLLASPSNSMQLVGHIVPGDTTSGVQVAQLPNGYWPVSEQIILARKGVNTFPATVAVLADGRVMVYDPPPPAGLLQLSPTIIALDK